jgi:O-antigen/teichoic acid export membrane protein
MSPVQKNFVANTYQSLLLIIGQIVLVPMFIKGWGTTLYGEWLVLFAIPSYLALSDFGIVSAFGNRFVITYNSGAKDRAMALFGAVFRYQGYINSSIVICVAVSCTEIPIKELFNLEQMSGFQCSFVVVVLALYTAIAIQGGVFSAIYRVAGKYYVYLTLEGHFRFLEIVATAASLWFRTGPEILASVLLIIRLALFLTIMGFARSFRPSYPISFHTGHWTDFRGLISTGLGFMLIPIGSSLANQVTTFMVNWLGGAHMVVVLNVLRQLSRVFQQLSFNISNAIRPEFTAAYTERNVSRMRRFQFGGLLFVGISAVPFATVIYWFGPNVIYWWTRGIEVTNTMTLLFGLESVLAALAYTGSIGAWASNRVRKIGVSYLITQAAGAALATLLFGQWGLGGVAVVFAIANLIYFSVTIYESYQCIQPRSTYGKAEEAGV